MVTIERFEDIEAWPRTRELTRAVCEASSDGAFARDRSLFDQIRRAAVSVMPNTAEGFDREGSREIVHFLPMAKGSAAELQSQLYVALDAGHVSDEDFQPIAGLGRETGQLLGGLIRYLKSNRDSFGDNP